MVIKELLCLFKVWKNRLKHPKIRAIVPNTKIIVDKHILEEIQ